MRIPKRTPAKLILSGEHAVVYGSPAIACAINRFASVHIAKRADNLFEFHCNALGKPENHTLEELETLKEKCEKRHEEFCKKKREAKTILDRPIELCLYTLSKFMRHSSLEPQTGLTLTFDIDIPLSSGMGSSAAVIVSLIRALCEHYSKTLSDNEFFMLALSAENLQHGHSSGLDLRVCYSAGVIYQSEHDITRCDIKTLPFYIINTGRPDCSTGECVEHVNQAFSSSNIWNSFTTVTNQFLSALQEKNDNALAEAIHSNHDLLCKIDVVPKKAQDFIQQLNQHNIAAKICGAGAIHGDKAGMLICTMNDKAIELCQENNYSISPLKLIHNDS
jgi:mevalonate kinase